jgi:hypothetical protein
MIVNIESKFKKDFDTVVTFLRKSETLLYVSKPMISFFPAGDGLPEQWCAGKYETEMKLFGTLSLGKQTICIEEICGFTSSEFILRDNGFGDSSSRWDHWMFVRKTDDHNRVRYTDRVEVKAGILTPAIALFAAFFYSWRQHRWKKLIRRDMDF